MAPYSDSRYGALLHEPWKVHPTYQDRLIGTWAEDGSEFEIHCPHQLRDLIVQLQNRIALHYKGMIFMQNEARKITDKFVELLGDVI